MGIYFVENGRRRRGEKFVCATCGKEFVGRVDSGRKYCSWVCSSASQCKRIELECYFCGMKFTCVPSRLLLSKHGVHFCSRVCKDQAQSLIGNCGVIRPSHYGTGTKGTRNSVFFELMKKGCVDCGEMISYYLDLHHIDGDRSNNESSNWECVCARHHRKRHLKLVGDVWVRHTQSLTPREMLDVIP